MTINEKNAARFVSQRTVRMAPEPWEEGMDTEYIHEQFSMDDNKEELLNSECANSKTAYLAAWGAATRQEEFLQRQGERQLHAMGKEINSDTIAWADRQRVNIDNRAHYKDTCLQVVRRCQFSEDQFLMGHKTKNEHMRDLTKVLKYARLLLANKALRTKRGFTYTSVGALVNNVMSLLETMGVDWDLPSKTSPWNGKRHGLPVPRSQWVTKYKSDEILDFDTNETAQQTLTGEDWTRDIQMSFYEIS
jgi:hypothetical protein